MSDARDTLEREFDGGYALIGFPTVFWRYSRLALDTFPFWEASSERELLGLARGLLATDPIATWLDSLLERPSGHHRSLAASRETSDSNRSMWYVANLLVSLVIGHHTGRKGGIGVVPGSTHGEPRRARAMGRLTPPPGLELSFEGEARGLVSSLVPHRQSETSYEVLVDPSPGVRASAKTLADHQTVARIMSRRWIDRTGAAGRDFAPVFAVDSMEAGRGADFFELHAPARSFGAHALAASAVEIGAEADSLAAFGRWISEATAGRRLTLVPIEHDTTFHRADHAALASVVEACREFETAREGSVALLSEVGRDRRLSQGSIDLGWVWDRFEWRRAVDDALGPRADWSRIGRGDWPALERALSAGDRWLVLKPQANYPWWDHTLPGVTPIWSLSRRHRLVARRMLDRADLIVEPLNRRSLDTYGRSGELRSFWALVPPVAEAADSDCVRVKGSHAYVAR